MTSYLRWRHLLMCFGFLLTSMVAGFSAQLLGNEITLCPNGYSSPDDVANNVVSCKTYSAGNCAAGYIEFINNGETFTGVYDNRCAISTYKKQTVPDTTIVLTYNGIVVGDPIDLCNGGYASKTGCTQYAKHDCENGYYEQTENTETFIGVYDNRCAISTYKKREVPATTVVLTYRGVVTNDAEWTLCDGGYSSDHSTCTAYGTGYCWNGYYDMNLGASTFSDQTSGACASNTHAYTIEACGYNPTGDTCLDVCGNGQMYTDVGTCASLCPLGVTTLRTSTGLVIPMWSSKQISPSINIGMSNGTCYVNLAPGTTSGHAIMIQYDNTTYHTTQ